AYVEIHVEQGPIMEKAGARLGLVTAIAGQRRYEIEVIGESGHAGTVPMEGRCDALAAAAEVMVELENVARLVGGCVLTIGYLVVEPNQTNVIPSRVVFRVDLRSVDEKKVERLDQYVLDSCARINTGRCATTHIKTLEARNSVPMDERLRKTLRSALEPLGERVLDLPSGAGHDAMCIAAIAPTAMIFVPSVGGKSHVVEEFTTPGDLELGVEALTRSIVAIDASLTGGT
ncbi:MAG: hydantoinase/carbamoylase family amidase, partial [Candidatus Eremiobacteraeota bacterium]|nr:hydantoinase/carbamoylase family amidase [Candidatus Eremiobacteraeota bacterium]